MYGNPVTSLAEDQDLLVVGLEDGSEARACAVVIATGVSYRLLQVPELEELAGAGVFYGAGTIEAQAVAGKPAFVVGGGNSAGQAALHLSKYAQQVTILVRSQTPAASMSDYLIRQIEAAPNVDVRYHCEVAGGGGSGHLEQLLLRNRDSGETEVVPAAVASAVGDGSTAIRLIHYYLALAPSVREGHESRLAHCRATLPRLRCFTRHGRGIC